MDTIRINPLIVSVSPSDHTLISPIQPTVHKGGIGKLISVVAMVAIPFAAPIVASSIGLSSAIATAVGSKIIGTVVGSAMAGAALGAVANGAILIEKHFILNKSIVSADSSFSMTPESFLLMSNEIRNIEKILGSEEIEQNDFLKKSRLALLFSPLLI